MKPAAKIQISSSSNSNSNSSSSSPPLVTPIIVDSSKSKCTMSSKSSTISPRLPAHKTQHSSSSSSSGPTGTPSTTMQTSTSTSKIFVVTERVVGPPVTAILTIRFRVVLSRALPLLLGIRSSRKDPNNRRCCLKWCMKIAIAIAIIIGQ